MRTGLVLSILALLNLVVLVPAVQADVIPTKVAGKSDQKARAQVEQRLVELGMDQAEAKAHASELPSQAVLHYAQSPHSIQTVSGIYLEEAIFGALVLGALGAVAWNITDDADN